MDTFGALADPTRRQVLDLLSRRERTAGELGIAFPSVSQPGMSRHLRVLREVGLVRVRQESRHRIYSLRSEGLASVDAWISKYRGFWKHELDALETYLDRQAKAPTARPHRARRR
ncbi:MAG TPA: metalloregulator ArsR/SmtB family transcription factor [Thermoplasmata archaeon]|nr:metalloregulator ArsR/SmtB family transcription factor [Thermoplasmata archaeon]